jgi:hypothetical protein
MDFFKKPKARQKAVPVTIMPPDVSYDIAMNRLAIAIELLLANPLDMKKWLALDLNQEYDSWKTVVVAYLISKGVNGVGYIAESTHVLLRITYIDTHGQSDYLYEAAPPWVWKVENSLIAHKHDANTYEKTTISATRAINSIEQADGK